jgi:hypothetical protein
MPLTSAEKQARYRARNMILLTADARAIADKLMAMEDRAKLVQVVALLRNRLEPTDGRCRWVKDDGGRRKSGIARAAGRKDEVGDCVTRAIAIATERPYREVHDALIVAAVQHVAAGKSQSDWAKWARRRGGFRAFHADHGVHTDVSSPYLEALGWKYTSTKELPRGKGVHLRADELPRGRLIVQLPGHLVAVINGVIHDTHDCSDDGRCRIQGYWTAPRSRHPPHREGPRQARATPRSPQKGRPAREARDEPYDAAADFAGSLDDCYAVVRERVRAGGKGWPS